MKKIFIFNILFYSLTINAQITEDLLKTQLVIESGNKHYDSTGAIITSSMGAVGIAQFIPTTWDWLVVTRRIPEGYDITNEIHQKKAQRVYMAYLYAVDYGISTEQTSLAFASYNAGVYRIKKLVRLYGLEWKKYLPKETKNYLYKLKI